MWSQILGNPSSLNRLKGSKFRRDFSLDYKNKRYIEEYGMREVALFAYDVVNKNLRIKPNDDGKQTPYKGHPVFIAQHATATCCRKCLFKWYRIPPYRELTDGEVKFVVSLIIKWVDKQFQTKKQAY